MSPVKMVPQDIRMALHAFALAGHWDAQVLKLFASITQYKLSKSNQSLFAPTVGAFARLAPLAHKATMSKTEVAMYSALVAALVREVAARGADGLTEEEQKQLREAQQYIAQLSQ
jgi:hypothetical protein